MALSITVMMRSLGLYRLSEWLLSVQDRFRRKGRRLFYSSFIAKGDLCYDVGANIGNRTEIFLMLGARVVAVEPQTNCAKRLKTRFGLNPNFVLVKAGLDEENQGSKIIHISRQSGLSSMSEEWIKSVTESGRFGNEKWTREEEIPVRTLDSLIFEYGLPSFCKIDVEGFELNVIKGLSKAVRTISFEFTPERIEPSLVAIKHLDSIGPYLYNYSIGESMHLELRQWVSAEDIRTILISLKGKTVYGDVYASTI